MINIKWGGICAGSAFALALALSLLIGQTSLPIALLRAVVFAFVFFGLGIAAWSLINTFLPELLSSSVSKGDIASSLFSTGASGSQVNITVDDEHNAALPEQDIDASGDVGEFTELFSSQNTNQEDIDQIPATGYTEEGETGEFSSGDDTIKVDNFSPTEGFGSSEGFGSVLGDTGLQDENEGEDEAGEFSMDFSAFVPGGLGGGDGGNSETDEPASDTDSFSFFPETMGSANYDEPEETERKPSRNKPMKLEGDFDAKEIAAGLRTVLNKDKK